MRRKLDRVTTERDILKNETRYLMKGALTYADQRTPMIVSKEITPSRIAWPGELEITAIWLNGHLLINSA